MATHPKKTDVKPLLDAIAVIQEFTVERSETPADRQARLELQREDGRREHERERLRMRLITGMAAFGLVVVCFLCWLFLHYQKPEQVENIIALIVSFAGGFGLGRVAKKS